MNGIEAKRWAAATGALASILLSSLAWGSPTNLPVQWPMPAGDLANTRFSALSEITPDNIAQLKLAFTFSTGTLKGQEAAPIVSTDTMYIVTPYPNRLFAIALDQPGGPARWSFDPQPSASSQGVACCDPVNRGATLADGRLFFNTLDAQTIAVDAKSGKELWRVKLGDITHGETMTMAPLVVGDKVLVGNSGGEFGVRGWLTALDAASGKLLWRAYSTGPDKDVLIGPDFKPFYASEHGSDLGVKSWPPGAWQTRRRHRVGVDLVRSRAQSHILRNGQSGSVECGSAPRRQQVDCRHLCAKSRHGCSALVLSVQPSRSL